MRQFVVITVSWSWRTVFWLNPQVDVVCEGWDQMRKMRDNQGRPIAVLANHCSFMDTLSIVAFIPWFIIKDCKTLFKSTLMDLFVFGDIARGCRHIPVFFKADVSGQFSVQSLLIKFAIISTLNSSAVMKMDSTQVDPSKKQITSDKLNYHLSHGRSLSMFHEGIMNL